MRGRTKAIHCGWIDHKNKGDFKHPLLGLWPEATKLRCTRRIKVSTTTVDSCGTHKNVNCKWLRRGSSAVVQFELTVEVKLLQHVLCKLNEWLTRRLHEISSKPCQHQILVPHKHKSDHKPKTEIKTTDAWTCLSCVEQHLFGNRSVGGEVWKNWCNDLQALEGLCAISVAEKATTLSKPSE